MWASLSADALGLGKGGIVVFRDGFVGDFHGKKGCGGTEMTKQRRIYLSINDGVVKGAICALSLLAATSVAQAGSISANTGTYAGDVSALNFPVGTVAISNYTAYRHGDKFIDSEGVEVPDSSLDLYTNIVRVDWLAAKIYDMPLAISAALPYGYFDDVEVGGRDVSAQSSFFSPNVFLTLGVVVDPQNERTLALTNYVFLPMGGYDSTKEANIATPDQWVIVPQIMYEEGLGKFSPALQNFWIDVFGGVAFHGDGQNPVTQSGVGFAKTEQENSYDINFYLRYNWNPLTFVAIGIEKSWGGEQIATGGVLAEYNGGNLSLGKDEFLKGHLQFAFPLSETFQIASDITHDFEREGGFKENFTAELRLTKILLPESEPLK